MLRNLSIKKQLIIGFLFVLCSSILLTVITFLIAFSWWMKGGSENILRADHYASYVPDIEEYVREKGDALLQETEWANLEKMIPTEGMTYQVIDESAQIVTGTFTEPVPGGSLAKVINQTVNNGAGGSNITYYIPISDQDGAIKGALGLNYNLSPSTASLIDFVIMVILFLSPFLYFTIFTFIASHFIGKKISQPIESLIVASHRIKERDLDFQLEYESKNELGELVSAFEKMRAELEKSLTREWELEAERRQYVDAISHDLKTPLTIIRGHAEALEDVWKNEEILQRYIKTIEANVDRVSHLLEEFNKINEFDSFEFNLLVSECEIETWLEEKLSEYKYLTGREGIIFKCELKNQQRLETFYLDEQRMSRVIDNLVMNSLRFTPKTGTIEINISLDAKSFEFHIYDSGKGFQTKNTEKLFTRFYQEDPARTSDRHSGQGLFIAKTIVEKHGGTIAAENWDGGGAHVWFWVPNQRKVEQELSEAVEA